MKSLVKLSLLFIITSLLFISCTSKLSVTKRHYTKGYHIAHNKGKQSKQTKQHAETNSTLKNPSPIYTLKVLPAESQVEKGKKEIDSSPITAEAVPTTQSEGHKPTRLLKQTKNTNHAHSQAQQLITPLKNLHTIYQLEKSHNGDSDSRGLSLFWVIILVILILWFFGYIAGWGTGGLINLLLLIALILFILWLLRII